jgi:hypothetical protein
LKSLVPLLELAMLVVHVEQGHAHVELLDQRSGEPWLLVAPLAARQPLREQSRPSAHLEYHTRKVTISHPHWPVDLLPPLLLQRPRVEQLACPKRLYRSRIDRRPEESYIAGAPSAVKPNQVSVTFLGKGIRPSCTISNVSKSMIEYRRFWQPSPVNTIRTDDLPCQSTHRLDSCLLLCGR